MSTKLYVASLPFSMDQQELEKMFSAVGTVVSVKLIMNTTTGLSKGFGFIEMKTEEEADLAISQLNETKVGDRTILVTKARREG